MRVRSWPRNRGKTVIIKSCNQLANLSSSVLIKPSPVISLSLSLLSPPSLLEPPFFSCRDLRTRNYSHTQFRASSFSSSLPLIFLLPSYSRFGFSDDNRANQLITRRLWYISMIQSRTESWKNKVRRIEGSGNRMRGRASSKLVKAGAAATA